MDFGGLGVSADERGVTAFLQSAFPGGQSADVCFGTFVCPVDWAQTVGAIEATKATAIMASRTRFMLHSIARKLLNSSHAAQVQLLILVNRTH